MIEVAHCLHDIEHERLPIGKEYDTFHTDELEKGLVWL
jgi:hypothetical protein